MRKPQNIVLGIVGAAVAGGAALTAFQNRPVSYRSSYRPPGESRGASLSNASVTLPDREYQNDEYIPSVGYYHAPNHAFYPYRWNHHDATLGYYHGGVWTAAAVAASVLSSRPSADELSRVRQLLARKRQEEQQRQQASSSSYRSGGSSYHYSSGSSFGRSTWGSSSSHTSFGGFGSHGSSSS